MTSEYDYEILLIHSFFVVYLLRLLICGNRYLHLCLQKVLCTFGHCSLISCLFFPNLKNLIAVNLTCYKLFVAYHDVYEVDFRFKLLYGVGLLFMIYCLDLIVVEHLRVPRRIGCNVLSTILVFLVLQHILV